VEIDLLLLPVGFAEHNGTPFGMDSAAAALVVFACTR
jgi:hypothetical protein